MNLTSVIKYTENHGYEIMPEFSYYVKTDSGLTEMIVLNLLNCIHSIRKNRRHITLFVFKMRDPDGDVHSVDFAPNELFG